MPPVNGSSALFEATPFHSDGGSLLTCLTLRLTHVPGLNHLMHAMAQALAFGAWLRRRYLDQHALLAKVGGVGWCQAKTVVGGQGVGGTGVRGPRYRAS